MDGTEQILNQDIYFQTLVFFLFVRQSRLDSLRSEVGVDSFKFDAGETVWLPSSYSLAGGEGQETWPALYTTT